MQLRSLKRSLELGARVLTGDDIFDQSVFLSDEPSIMSALDFHTRRLLVALVAEGLEAYGGGFVLDPWVTHTLADPVATVGQMFDLANKLSDVSAAKVARIIQTDPVMQTRQVFALRFEKDAGVQAAISEQKVRQVGQPSDEGFDALALAVSNNTLPESVRLEAIERLLSLFPLSRVVPILQSVDPEVVNACAELLTRWIASAADALLVLPILMRVASRRKLDPGLSGRLIAAIASNHNAALLPVLGALVEHNAEEALAALMGFDVPAHELEGVLSAQGIEVAEALVPQLCERHPKLDRRLLGQLYLRLGPKEIPAKARYLRLFATSGSPQFAVIAADALENTDHLDVRLAAIEALAKVGERKNIAALRPFTEGILRDAEIKTAARAAIDAIRERYPSEGDAGSVSIAADGGELSVTK